MCKRVFVLNKGMQIYDGNFNTLIKKINPERRLIFEFENEPDEQFINDLTKEYNFNINQKVITANLPDSKLQKLLSILTKEYVANNITFEDLPVDETMKNFFQNPSKYLK